MALHPEYTYSILGGTAHVLGIQQDYLALSRKVDKYNSELERDWKKRVFT
jgi:hypothetical protein